MTKLPSGHTIAGTTFTQTYSTTATTVANATAVAVATTAATNSTPYGFDSAEQADAIVANLNALVADVLVLRKVLNAVIDEMQTAGMVD